LDAARDALAHAQGRVAVRAAIERARDAVPGAPDPAVGAMVEHHQAAIMGTTKLAGVLR